MPSVKSLAPSVFDGRVPYPQLASIETTMKCNLQCPTTLDGECLLTDPAFEVPSALWEKLPPGSVCGWRGIAVYPRRRDLLQQAAFVRDPE
jgi:hypothetical protein